MMHKFSLSLCLLMSTICGGSSIPLVFAQTPPAAIEQLPTTPPVPGQTYNNAVLTPEDLPSGFKEIPPEQAKEIQKQFAILSDQLAKAGMKPERYFAFMSTEGFEIVAGFTGVIPKQSDQASFDEILKEMKQPANQQQLIEQVRASIPPDKGIKILDYASIPTVNNIGESAAAMTVGVDMVGQILQIDLAAFRRSNVGGFTAIFYRKGEKPTVSLDDMARKLDNRIVQTATGTIPVGNNGSQVTPPPTNPAGTNQPEITPPPTNPTGTNQPEITPPATNEMR